MDGRGDPRNDIDYFERGWLTSMEVVEFVTEIEAQFDMQFSDHDMQDSRFVTIAGLSELIEQRSAQVTSAQAASAQIKESR
ncbi:MAG TPA: phosphopantetheine-binding protein [Candidatus Sulfotelmatobacter sp.]|jgi:acyl carrier protein